ncbi:hypothetical protein [Streptomyces fagopyri]
MDVTLLTGFPRHGTSAEARRDTSAAPSTAGIRGPWAVAGAHQP